MPRQCFGQSWGEISIVSLELKASSGQLQFCLSVICDTLCDLVPFVQF